MNRPHHKLLLRSASAILALALLSFAPCVVLAQQTPPAPSLEEAIQGAVQRLAAAPEDRAMRWYLVRLHFARGARLAEMGNGPGAVESFTEALRVVQDGGVPMHTSEETFRAADGALAHAVTKLAQERETLGKLDEIIATLPGLTRAVLALGAARMRASDPAEFARGIYLLGSLKDSADTDTRQRAGATAAALAYDRAAVDFRAGRSQDALGALLKVREYFGERPFGSAAQNQNLRFAIAKGFDETGDIASALREYDALFQENPQYTLSGGTPVRALLADALYMRAVELLTLEGSEGASAVPALLDRLEQIEGADSIDLHHARYMSYRRLGDQAAAERERETIRRIDREYHDLLFPKE